VASSPNKSVEVNEPAIEFEASVPGSAGDSGALSFWAADASRFDGGGRIAGDDEDLRALRLQLREEARPALSARSRGQY
jgi:hypothetical protein